MRMVFGGCSRVLSDKGHFFLQMGGTSKRPLIPYEVVQEALAAGFVLQNEVTWVKNITVAGRSSGQFKPINSLRFLNNTNERIFHLTKNGEVPIDRLAVGVPFEYASNSARWEHKSTTLCDGNSWFIPYETIQSKADRANHPAVFPVALPERCIRLSGIPKGSLVLDPFCGSGTTLMACKNLGMRGIGFEISTAYCDAARKRLVI
jgi:site-specific DNA-methyltransferase (adenine-specific)